jgi:hypothetical protein
MTERLRSVRDSESLSPPPIFKLCSCIREQIALQMAEAEGRILLALQAYQLGQFPSLRAAARVYDVPQTTLARRHKGTPSKADSVSPHLKLTQVEEAMLVQWILSMDTRGISPTQALVKEMAELLLAEHVQLASAAQPKIGQRWVYQFIK